MLNTPSDSIYYQNEEEVKSEISTWLVKNGIEVYWEKKNSYGYDVFQTTTGMRKPDLLLKAGDNVILVEVKNAVSYSNMYDSFFQLLGYYNNISNVFLNCERLRVTGFVAASQYSILGRLFHEEPLETYKSFREQRKKVAIKGHIPFSEYKLTEMFIRLLWRAKQRPDVFIGGLLSTVLNYPSEPPLPMILGKSNGEQSFMGLKL